MKLVKRKFEIKEETIVKFRKLLKLENKHFREIDKDYHFVNKCLTKKIRMDF